MGAVIDLVADMGEGFGAYTMADDAGLLEVVTSANIACGFHAGDPRIMERTVRACAERGVGIGAHPSFPDLVGFGRRAMDLTPDEVRTDVLYQLGALSGFAAAAGTRVGHVCPHGRLGNLVITRPDYAAAMCDAIAGFDPSIVVYTQAGAVVDAARERGLTVGMVAAIDRNYEDDGTLTPRREPDAVIHDPELIVARTLRMVTEGTVVGRSGKVLPIQVDSVLLHGDGPDSLGLARRIRADLTAAGVTLATLAETLAGRS